MLVSPSIAEVFAVFEDPYNLIRITPGWLNLKVTNPERVRMRKGAEITYRIRWAGLPMTWKTVITEYAPPDFFVDEQVEGPYRLWRHRHEFTAGAEGVLVTDRVDYALPFGRIGHAAHAVAIGRQLIGIFQYRQAALAQILGGSAREVKEPVIRPAKLIAR